VIKVGEQLMTIACFLVAPEWRRHDLKPHCASVPLDQRLEEIRSWPPFTSNWLTSSIRLLATHPAHHGAGEDRCTPTGAARRDVASTVADRRVIH
jgi:hypothetical protein